MKKKGFFSVISGMFLIIVIVFSLIFFLSFQGFILKAKGITKQHADGFQDVKEFKGQLLLCHEQVFLTRSKLENSVCDGIPNSLAYEVHQKEMLGCTKEDWSKGSFTDNDERIVYKVAVRQYDGTMCLADLIIAAT